MPLPPTVQPSLFQFGSFFRWQCPCGVEIYATNDAAMKFQRSQHEQSCEQAKGHT
jgi:hypothetical protein